MVNLRTVWKDTWLNSHLFMPSLQAKISGFNVLAVTQDRKRDVGRASKSLRLTSPPNAGICEGSNLQNKDQLKRGWEFSCYLLLRS